MSDYSIVELEQWDKKIEKLAYEEGLDFYKQEFELVSYEEMIGYEAYTGMPTHYPHWSYGKAYEKIKTLNRYNLAGLPYEMVINSDPCIAYLMRDNTLLLQILTIAHVYAHNDFFKNNRLFRFGTRAEYTSEMFKNHAERIRGYSADPSIGGAKVERILNAAHAIRFQTSRTVSGNYGDAAGKSKTDKKKDSEDNSISNCSSKARDKCKDSDKDNDKFPPEPDEDILKFISVNSRLKDWEKDIIDMVRQESLYFIPQIETKIMNEGWASYWHYTLLQKLGLPQGLQLEFLKRHNQVVRPFEDGLNPYWLGFEIFKDINKRFGSSKIFEVRALERDESFIRRYLTYELCNELKLLEYVRSGSDYVVSEISDEDGWKKIRETIAASAGMGGIPNIRVQEWVRKDNTLVLEHVQDERELDLSYAYETLKHIVDLWEGKVVLKTFIDGKKKQITCDEQKKVSMTG